MSNFASLFENDPSLLLRMSLGYKLYLTQACSLFCSPLESVAPLSKFKKQLTDRDIAFLRSLLMDHLADIGQESQVHGHADLIAWTIERGVFVKRKF